ncbi:MAG: hypothetical protein EZS28_021347 [Streblomastix strix]|uniref:Serine/threonine specific protein phosphatases domain-containing protein n=1 Tax=Streblomastix strix TaxID=222440 RepID=A0A5J4VKK0_9EUKA|nr:MAG: hypothetical protein EZS28_021347 [Streblomastix strix]
MIWLTHIGESGIGKQLQEDWGKRRQLFFQDVQNCILDGNYKSKIQITGIHADDEEDGVIFDNLDALTSWERRKKEGEEKSIIQSVKENISRPRFHPLTPSFRSKQRVFRVIEEMEEELDTTFVTLNIVWQHQNLALQTDRLKLISDQRKREQQINNAQLNSNDEYQQIFGGGGMWSKRWGKFPKLNQLQEKEQIKENINEKVKEKEQNKEKEQEKEQGKEKEKENEDQYKNEMDLSPPAPIQEQSNQHSVENQKNLRFFIGKCNPELIVMRTLMTGLWESQTNKISTIRQSSQQSTSQSSNDFSIYDRIPFPHVLHNFQPPHAPIVPCNHKCGIVGTLHVWKRMFVVHSHRGHTRHFHTHAKQITRKELEDTFETNLNAMQKWSQQDQKNYTEKSKMFEVLELTKDDTTKMKNQLEVLLSEFKNGYQGLENINLLQYLQINDKVQQNIAAQILKPLTESKQQLIIAIKQIKNQTNLDKPPENLNEQQIIINPKEKCLKDILDKEQCLKDILDKEKCLKDILDKENCLKDILDKIEYPQPICILKGPAWDNYHRKSRSFFQCSETAATFGHNSQMFDPRSPVFIIQRFPSLTKLCLTEANFQILRPEKIRIPQIPDNCEAKFNQIIENRKQKNKDRQLGQENEIESEGLITQYYEIVEKQCQHIDIDIHFGAGSNQIINNSVQQLIDDIELNYKQGLLVVGDIHGNFNALLKVLDIVDDVLLLNKQSRGKVVFLGDYIDRGKYSLECAILIIAYKFAFPDRVFLLKGNHESNNI